MLHHLYRRWPCYLGLQAYPRMLHTVPSSHHTLQGMGYLKPGCTDFPKSSTVLSPVPHFLSSTSWKAFPHNDPTFTSVSRQTESMWHSLLSPLLVIWPNNFPTLLNLTFSFCLAIFPQNIYFLCISYLHDPFSPPPPHFDDIKLPSTWILSFLSFCLPLNLILWCQGRGFPRSIFSRETLDADLRVCLGLSKLWS